MLLLATAFFANDLARFGGFAIALGGFGYSVYLTYLEIFTIEAICQWCVASAVLMTILFLLNATRLIGYAGTDSAVLHAGPTSRSRRRIEFRHGRSGRSRRTQTTMEER